MLLFHTIEYFLPKKMSKLLSHTYTYMNIGRTRTCEQTKFISLQLYNIIFEKTQLFLGQQTFEIGERVEKVHTGKAHSRLRRMLVDLNLPK